jgi:MATE family multidrug resistance protein
MDKNNHWWTRPCGGLEVLRQAVPLIISGGCISLINFTDRMFLMWHSPDAMTASMQPGMLFWTTISIPSATAAFVTTFVAQYHGSGQNHRVGRVVWQGIWFGFFLMPILLLLYQPLTTVFVWFGHDAAMVELERTYYFYTLLGCGAAISGEAVASFFRGQGKMWIEMCNNIFCLVLNVGLDYCLIFGKFGFPAWGLAGAALVTAIVLWVRFLMYVILMFAQDWHANKFHVLGGMRLDFPLIGRLCYYGIPAGLYAFLDTLTFTAFILMIGGLGTVQRNATTIAFTLNSFTFIPLNGIGIAVTSMVGNQLGKNRPDLARRVAMTSVTIGCLYAGFFGAAFLFCPNAFLSLFSAYTSPEEFAAMRDLCIVLLRFIALYLFFDSSLAILFSTLRGAGDTIFIAWLTGLLAPLLPIGSFIGIYFFGLGVLWCWTVLTLYVFFYCICLMFRYRSKVWESMRVIEKEII